MVMPTKRPADDVLFDLIVTQRMKLSDIGKLYGVRHTTVVGWKKKLGVPPGIVIPFTKDDCVQRYYHQGLTHEMIAQEFQVSQCTVSKYMREWGFPTIPIDERTEITDPVELTPFQAQMVMGTMLGDSHIRPANKNGSGKNSLLICEHGDRQRDYLKHKFEVLSPYSSCDPYRYWRDDLRFKKGGAWISGCYSKAHRFWTRMRDVWYPEGVKIIPKNVLSMIGPEGLAYLYADDGSRHGMSCVLYILDFSKADVVCFQEMLRERFNLECSVKEFDHKDRWYLRFDRKQAQPFMRLIQDTFQKIPAVSYKFIPNPKP